MSSDLTPVEHWPECDVYAKRDDLACYAGPELPAGAKVRQFCRMIEQAPAAYRRLVVGCSADSAMQIYLAYAGERYGIPADVFVADRAAPTAATKWAAAHGATIHRVRPGYLSCIRKAARVFGQQMTNVVRWDTKLAFDDTVEQCANLPPNISRIVVPVGSGLTVAAVIAGVAKYVKAPVLPSVVGVCVSGMATAEGVQAKLEKWAPWVNGSPWYLWQHPTPYNRPWYVMRRSTGLRLDPYYAAKVLPLIKPGCLLWLPGLRPYACFGTVRQQWQYVPELPAQAD